MAMTDISALAQMLNPKDEGDSDSDNDCVKYTPADIGNSKPKSKIPDVSNYPCLRAKFILPSAIHNRKFGEEKR